MEIMKENLSDLEDRYEALLVSKLSHEEKKWHEYVKIKYIN